MEDLKNAEYATIDFDGEREMEQMYDGHWIIQDLNYTEGVSMISKDIEEEILHSLILPTKYLRPVLPEVNVWDVVNVNVKGTNELIVIDLTKDTFGNSLAVLKDFEGYSAGTIDIKYLTPTGRNLLDEQSAPSPIDPKPLSELDLKEGSRIRLEGVVCSNDDFHYQILLDGEEHQTDIEPHCLATIIPLTTQDK